MWLITHVHVICLREKAIDIQNESKYIVYHVIGKESLGYQPLILSYKPQSIIAFRIFRYLSVFPSSHQIKYMNHGIYNNVWLQ